MAQQSRSAPGAQTNNFDSSNRSGRWIDLTLRLASVCAGSAIIAAATFAVIDAGKLTGPHAGLVSALASGCVIGSVVVTISARWTAAVVVLALLAGEAFNLLSTAERVIGQRAASQAMARQQNDVRVAAVERLAKAEAALTAFQDQSRETVAEKSCKAECRQLLEKQLEGLRSDVVAVRHAAEAAPAEAEESPLASRLGVQPWLLDLISAGLLSVGSNLLGAVLIGWGARPMDRAFMSQKALDHDRQPMPAEASESQETRLIQAVNHDDDSPDGDGGKPLPVSERTRGVLRLIEGHGGTIQGSQREIAGRIGMPQASFNRALAEAREAGLLDVSADRQAGTIIRLRRTA